MGDQVAVGGIGVVGEPIDHQGRMPVMQGPALTENLPDPLHICDHPGVQRPMPGALGVAVAAHQALFAGEVPLGGALQFAQLAKPPAAPNRRDQPARQRLQPAVLPVDQGMPESGYVDAHRRRAP